MLYTLLPASAGVLFPLIITINNYWVVIVCQVFPYSLYMYHRISFLCSQKTTGIPISYKKEQSLTHITQLATRNTRSKFPSRIPFLPHPVVQSYLTTTCSMKPFLVFPVPRNLSFWWPLQQSICSTSMTLIFNPKYADWFKNIYKQWTMPGTGYAKFSKTVSATE